MGDLSENSGYTSARQELSFVDGRIREIETIIETAEIVEEDGQTDKVSMSNKVTLKSNGKTEIYQIVGEYEADPINKKISPSSPLGKALMGKKVGDTVYVEAPAGKISYQIIKIE